MVPAPKPGATVLIPTDAIAAKVAELGEVTIGHNAGEEGKLFGSVGTHDIADAISKAGVEVARHEIAMPEGPIRQVGEYELELNLHTDVTQTIKVNVVAA